MFKRKFVSWLQKIVRKEIEEDRIIGKAYIEYNNYDDKGTGYWKEFRWKDMIDFVDKYIKISFYTYRNNSKDDIWVSKNRVIFYFKHFERSKAIEFRVKKNCNKTKKGGE